MAGKSQSNICYMQPRIFYAASQARNPGIQVFRFSDFQIFRVRSILPDMPRLKLGHLDWVRGEVLLGESIGNPSEISGTFRYNRFQIGANPTN